VEPERERPPDPPASWQEHWFDHRQLLQLYYSNDDCAIYTDPDVRWQSAMRTAGRPSSRLPGRVALVQEGRVNAFQTLASA
jgi:hypothetical protein